MLLKKIAKNSNRSYLVRWKGIQTLHLPENSIHMFCVWLVVGGHRAEVGIDEQYH